MKPPHFWNSGLDPRSREAAPLTRALLTPLSWLYKMGLRRKLAKATHQRVDIPVICVGNLTVGGVGKTPIVAAIRERLQQRGLRAASLSRGYGGSHAGPLHVDPDNHTASDVGDEPLMLAKLGETWIGRDRPSAARAMAQAGVDVIIMDDGHQNPSLHKMLSLVAIDATAPFGNGCWLPKGPLREPPMDGLARADGVFLVGDGEVSALEQVADCPILRVHLKPVSDVPGAPLVAFAGIGRPQKMFDSLTVAGADLCEAVGYGDHHVYSARDLAFLRKLASDHDARLITTEKDHVRLPADWRADVLTWPIAAIFDDTDALDALLSGALEQTPS